MNKTFRLAYYRGAIKKCNNSHSVGQKAFAYFIINMPLLRCVAFQGYGKVAVENWPFSHLE